MPVFTSIIYDADRNPLHVDAVEADSEMAAWETLSCLAANRYPSARGYELWQYGRKLLDFHGKVSDAVGRPSALSTKTTSAG